MSDVANIGLSESQPSNSGGCSSAALDYVAICSKCGGLVGWASQRLSAKELSKTVASWMRYGDSVERATTEDAKLRHFGHRDGCEHKKSKPSKKQKTLPVT